jgi:hypothetical protein
MVHNESKIEENKGPTKKLVNKTKKNKLASTNSSKDSKKSNKSIPKSLSTYRGRSSYNGD